MYYFGILLNVAHVSIQMLIWYT